MPSNYTEFKIPKKSGGFRTVCAPSITLLKYQRGKLSKLEYLYTKNAKEMNVNNIAHGFLSYRNCITGAEQHIGYKTTLMMDISNFFNSITKTKILDNLPNGLISKLKNKAYYNDIGEVAQGFATSPIIANIYSLPIIARIKYALQSLFNRLEDSDFAFTMYADDIQISFNQEDKKTINSIKAIVTEAFNEYELDINEKKTRVRFAKFGYRRILGVNVGDTEIRATRKVMRKIRAASHQENFSSLGGLIGWSECKRPMSKEDKDAFYEKKRGETTTEAPNTEAPKSNFFTRVMNEDISESCDF